MRKRRPKALADWCAEKGLPYPLPGAAAIPATNAAALAEIERLKAEIGRLKAELKEAKDGEVAADHPNYPPELDIAMTAWRAAIVGWKKNSGQPPREYIAGWLRARYPNLRNEQVERIGTVANWDKNPGRKRRLQK